jgi:hypothetical protein
MEGLNAQKAIIFATKPARDAASGPAKQLLRSVGRFLEFAFQCSDMSKIF